MSVYNHFLNFLTAAYADESTIVNESTTSLLEDFNEEHTLFNHYKAQANINVLNLWRYLYQITQIYVCKHEDQIAWAFQHSRLWGLDQVAACRKVMPVFFPPPPSQIEAIKSLTYLASLLGDWSYFFKEIVIVTYQKNLIGFNAEEETKSRIHLKNHGLEYHSFLETNFGEICTLTIPYIISLKSRGDDDLFQPEIQCLEISGYLYLKLNQIQLFTHLIKQLLLNLTFTREENLDRHHYEKAIKYSNLRVCSIY